MRVIDDYRGPFGRTMFLSRRGRRCSLLLLRFGTRYLPFRGLDDGRFSQKGFARQNFVTACMRTEPLCAPQISILDVFARWDPPPPLLSPLSPSFRAHYFPFPSFDFNSLSMQRSALLAVLFTLIGLCQCSNALSLDVD